MTIYNSSSRTRLIIVACAALFLFAVSGQDPIVRHSGAVDTCRVADKETGVKEKAASPIGRKIENFELRDFRGKTVKLSDFSDAKLVVVAFIGTECPLAKLYTPRLEELQKKYKQQGVAVLAINANSQDSITEIAHHARIHKVSFPVLKDVGNHVADQFGAVRTPEVFLLDQKRIIRYWGCIDDQYGVGYQRQKAERPFLANAIDDVLANRPVRRSVVESVGCHIGRVREPDKNSKVTYSNQIARIMQNNCNQCHREGEIAPFSLQTYEDVSGWSEMIEEVVRERRMPPWHANPKHGHFSNDARLSKKEKQQIYDWVEAGAPEGDPKQLPAPRKFTKGWQIPKPDKIIYATSEPVIVPAEGTVPYKYFFVDPGFKEDKWIQAAQCLPGERSVVHHILVFIQPPGKRISRKPGTIRSDFLAAMSPGAPPMNLPKGTAKFIPAGSRLIFQIHYTPNGTEQKDRSSLGLVFADPKTVHKELGTWRAVNNRFVIPPGVENHKVTAGYKFKEDTLLLGMFPHMHLRGKAFRYEAEFSDGHREILLDVPNYDFNWQNSYVLETPKLLPAGTKLICTATYDNSEENLSNPDPTKRIRWGDQSWDEMMIGYFFMLKADQDLQKDKQRK